MHTSIRQLTLASALAVMTGGVAFATPLPNPPFTTGGFVPPDSAVLKQELAVGKLLTKYAVSRGKCDAKALLALQLAYEPVGMPKVPTVQAAWVDCQAGVLLKYEVRRDKLLLKGTPPCLDQAGIEAIRTQIDAQFPPIASVVYCDGGAIAPDPVTGLNIPDFRNEAKGEVAAAKVLTKGGIAAGKCYTLALKYAFKFGGTLPSAILERVGECFSKALDAGNDAMDKLEQTQALPSCLSVATAQSLVSSIVGTSIAAGTAGQFNDETYCAE